jgi:hypothetical protein
MENPHCVHTVWDEEAREWVASSRKVTVPASGVDSAQTFFDQCKSPIPGLRSRDAHAGTKPATLKRLARQFELAT